MRLPQRCIATMVVLGLISLHAELPAQNGVNTTNWEVGFSTTAGFPGAEAFDGAGIGVGATAFIGYRVAESLFLRGGLSYEGQFDVGDSFEGGLSLDAAAQYWSLFVGPVYCACNGTSRVAPYVSGRLALMRERGGWPSSSLPRTGLGIGGSSGARVRLVNAVGIELGIDAFWGRFRHQFRSEPTSTWQSGFSLMLKTGLVFSL